MNHIVTIWRVQVKHRVDQSGVDIIYIICCLYIYIGIFPQTQKMLLLLLYLKLKSYNSGVWKTLSLASDPL